jgi:hypothetical protein
MTSAIKMPLRSLNIETIQDLQEKYPEAEISVEFQPNASRAPLSDNHFWKIIDLLDWTQSDDDSIIEPSVADLASGSVRSIFEFADLLSEKLYALDGKVFAQNMGETSWLPDSFFSVDNFLYARCCVIANGQEFYEKVLQNPTLMPKDLTFESLLYLPSMAYDMKQNKKYTYSPTYPIETFSNKAAWK